MIHSISTANMSREDWLAERRITDMEMAHRSAAVGRARRKMRAKSRQEYEAKKNFRLGLAFVSVPALMLMLIAYIVEVIA